MDPCSRQPARGVPSFLIPFLAVLFLIYLIATEEQPTHAAITLHSEQVLNASYYFYAEDFLPEEDAYDSASWFTSGHDGARSLKSGGGRSGGSSRSSGSRSYGNCYGDRCDNAGGSSTQLAIIVGSVVGGCCVLLGIYCLYHYCKQKMKENRRKERRKNKKNRVSHSDISDDDLEPPVEPIVIMPGQGDQYGGHSQQHHQNQYVMGDGQSAYQQHEGYSGNYNQGASFAATPVLNPEPYQKAQNSGYVMGAGALPPHAQVEMVGSTNQSQRQSQEMTVNGMLAPMQQPREVGKVSSRGSRRGRMNVNDHTSNNMSGVEDTNFNHGR